MVTKLVLGWQISLARWEVASYLPSRHCGWSRLRRAFSVKLEFALGKRFVEQPCRVKVSALYSQGFSEGEQDAHALGNMYSEEN